MIANIQSMQSISRLENVKNQLVLEKELQHFFKATPPLKIEDEFSKINGAVSSQFIYLRLALKVIEELDVEPVQAYALLEAIRPIIFDKFRIITSRFIGKTVVNNTRAYDVLFDAIDLFSRLTATYDSVIDEAKYFGESQTFIMGSAIHRALADKSRLILCYQQLYQDIPDSIWRHINKLYLTAEDYNIFNHALSDKLVFPNHALTVKQIYLYTMLLAAAGTNKLSIDDIAALSELLKGWIIDIGIKKRRTESENQPPENLLCMDPTRFLYPKFRSQIEDDNDENIFYFDLEKLRQKLLRSHVVQAFVNGKRITLSIITFNKIMTNWTVNQQRESPRIFHYNPVCVTACIGVSLDSLLSSVSFNRSGDKTIKDFNSRSLKLSFNPLHVNLEPIVSIPATGASSFSVKIVDHSDSGYCMEWPENSFSQLSNGEIILIEDKTDQKCKLGQVVWIKLKAGRVLQTGVSILSSSISPVILRNVKRYNTGGDTDIYESLIILNQYAEKNAYSIVVKKSNLVMGQILEVIQDSKSYYLQLLEFCSQDEKYQVFNVAFYE